MLSSRLVYLLTVLKPIEEVLEEIDKIRKRFLWAGDKELTWGDAKSIGPKPPCRRNMAAWACSTWRSFQGPYVLDDSIRQVEEKEKSFQEPYILDDSVRQVEEKEKSGGRRLAEQ